MGSASGRQTVLTGELALPAEQAMDAEFVLAPPAGGMNEAQKTVCGPGGEDDG